MFSTSLQTIKLTDAEIVTILRLLRYELKEQNVYDPDHTESLINVISDQLN